MADVFISYKSEDRAAAKLFAEALTAEGVSVWWDPVLRTGETYDEVIERNLREAALVLVLWSPRSVKSKWVRAEATIGERKGGLMPVLIETCERPIAFELVQTADLADWAGDRADVRWLEFMGDLRNALAMHQAEVRAHTAPPPPDAQTIETLFWNSIKDAGDRGDFEAYLQRYPHGQFLELARDRVTAAQRRADANAYGDRVTVDDPSTPVGRWLTPVFVVALLVVIGIFVLNTMGIFSQRESEPSEAWATAPAEPADITPSADATPPEIDHATISNPVWLERPTAADFARYYPLRALDRAQQGRVILVCTVQADGRLSCSVSSEDPTGWGFAEASLRVSRHFRMANDVDGRPTEGGTVRIPLAWRLS